MYSTKIVQNSDNYTVELYQDDKLILTQDLDFRTNQEISTIEQANEFADFIVEEYIKNDELQEELRKHIIPEPPQPTTEDYLLDLDFRLSMLELGL